MSIVFNTTCWKCGHVDSYELDVTLTEWSNWKQGMLIQDAMPRLGSSQRELLISGTCYRCQNHLFESDIMDEEDG